MQNKLNKEELIELGYQDAMWDKDAILKFFEQQQPTKEAD